MIDFTIEEKQDLPAALMQLFEIVTLLRSPEGCPWDREQDVKSVALNLLDETYEYLDAVIADDLDGTEEELGDIFLNAMMLLEMHQESEEVNILSSINRVCAKLVRRHPHVFADHNVQDSSEVLDLWNKIKVEVEGKKSKEDDFFSRVPPSLPPLEMSNEIQKKIRKVGFDWPSIDGVFDKVEEELAEVKEAYENKGTPGFDLELELGDLLFAVVNLARYAGISPSLALHRSNQKMKNRFNQLYVLAAERHVPLNSDNLKAMDEIWEEIKQGESY